MEIDSGSYIHQDLMAKTYLAKHSIDRRPIFFDTKAAIEDYKPYLEEKVQNPTKAKLAMQKMYNKEGIFYPEYYKKHQAILEKNPEIDYLATKVKNIESKQSKSLSLRNKLIKLNRVNLDYVTPKLTGLDKLLLKLKLLF